MKTEYLSDKRKRELGELLLNSLSQRTVISEEGPEPDFKDVRLVNKLLDVIMEEYDNTSSVVFREITPKSGRSLINQVLDLKNVGFNWPGEICLPAVSRKYKDSVNPKRLAFIPAEKIDKKKFYRNKGFKKGDFYEADPFAVVEMNRIEPNLSTRLPHVCFYRKKGKNYTLSFSQRKGEDYSHCELHNGIVIPNGFFVIKELRVSDNI